MVNKVYEEVKKIIKENYKFFLILILSMIICNIELPYYIEAPGGIINIEERIKIEDSNRGIGSLNMAYVSGYKATLPTVLIAKINKNWNLIKKEKNNINMTNEADYFRNHILLQEANQNAVELAYKTAGKQVNKKNTKLYVTYIYEKADTDIQIGDRIIKINNCKIESKEDIKKVINESKKNFNIDIIVENNEKEIHRSAKLIKYNNNYILGIAISEINDIEVIPNIEFNFKKSESGPSGGLMVSLAIYNALTKEDITKGRKIVGTGTIDKNGNVGQIDGVEYKLKAAVKENAEIFLVPSGENYEQAQKLQKEENYIIKIVPVNTFEEAIDYLKTN